MSNTKTLKSDATYARVAVELVDDPLTPTRATMDETKLAELIESIGQLGILQPVVLQRQEDGRYRVCAGHRRLVAARALNLKTVPAMIYPATSTLGVAIQCVENAVRESVNPAEEAGWLQVVLAEHCENDTERLAGLVKRSRGYVEERLALLAGDPDVFRAVAEKRVSLAGARELNRITDRKYRMLYLDAASRTGATAAQITRWRVEWQQLVAITAGSLVTAANDPVTASSPAPRVGNACFICEDSDEPWDMELLFVHKRCRKIFLDRFLENIGAGREQRKQGGVDGAAS